MTLPRLAEVFIIREAKCPYCGSNGAYVGFSSVECDNPSCSHYKDDGKGGSPSREASRYLWSLLYGALTDDIPIPPNVDRAMLEEIFGNTENPDNGPPVYNPKKMTPEQKKQLREFLKFSKTSGTFKGFTHPAEAEKSADEFLRALGK